MAINLAWPGMMRTSVVGASKRTALVISFVAAEPSKHSGTIIPNYEHVGDHVGAYLAVLFGKRFDNLGIVESHGRFGLPDVSAYGVPYRIGSPHNSDSPRIDIPIPLNFSEIRRIHSLLQGEIEDVDAVRRFNAACQFYYRAVGNVDSDPEVAYLHLTMAGEILAGAEDVSDADLLDDQLKDILEQVASGLADGGRAARLLRSRLYQVKRRFRHVLNSFLDNDFFARTEAQHEFGKLKREDVGDRLGAAYDLRSKYVHSGESYGGWIAPGRSNDEVQIGRPVVADAAFARALYMAPTFIGLERIMRYCLLRFAEKRFGIDLAVENPSEASGVPATAEI
ncbi:hypothetical protein FJ420_31925 [Mesorhizobium sp. B3-1-3]|uniref:HEPN domain-containing protein n=1 Tax=unclassified Mesorhizobium TaxID=325217 RepID=UPI0011285162|nr:MULTISPECIES: HEPN domain-containing protein [unclassified Mesorhizobium]TPI53310.1 hypothetical protein FJ424_32260 [Mesorhizobium sp. B3-1-8]TPI60085.1 hypothetical protein FJ420_31925 [Mesorhizobium sp. B3-1-3]